MKELKTDIHGIAKMKLCTCRGKPKCLEEGKECRECKERNEALAMREYALKQWPSELMGED